MRKRGRAPNRSFVLPQKRRRCPWPEIALDLLLLSEGHGAGGGRGKGGPT